LAIHGEIPSTGDEVLNGGTHHVGVKITSLLVQPISDNHSFVGLNFTIENYYLPDPKNTLFMVFVKVINGLYSIPTRIIHIPKPTGVALNPTTNPITITGTVSQDMMDFNGIDATIGPEGGDAEKFGTLYAVAYLPDTILNTSPLDTSAYAYSILISGTFSIEIPSSWFSAPTGRPFATATTAQTVNVVIARLPYDGDPGTGPFAEMSEPTPIDITATDSTPTTTKPPPVISYDIDDQSLLSRWIWFALIIILLLFVMMVFRNVWWNHFVSATTSVA
jgi:hypothetical protein